MEGTWELYVGEYELYRQAEDGEYYSVDAEFTSINPQNIQIFADSITHAQLNFRVDQFEEDIVTDGHLTFDINIDDSPENSEEPSEPNNTNNQNIQ